MIPPEPVVERPHVTVVMPVLDEERHLADSVARVLSQDYDGPLDLVLALGPSTDGTDEVAARIRTACQEMPDPDPLTMFDHIYVEDHPVVAAERAEFEAYHASFVEEGSH